MDHFASGTYVSLMHDDYPPFRSDIGGDKGAAANLVKEE